MSLKHVHYLEKALLEVHSITPHVCICYPLRRASRVCNDPDGRHHLIHTFERCDEPYIAFARVDMNKKGEKYLNVDSPAAKGMSAEVAAEMAQALASALEYLGNEKLDGEATPPSSPPPSPTAS